MRAPKTKGSNAPTLNGMSLGVACFSVGVSSSHHTRAAVESVDQVVGVTFHTGLEYLSEA